jgi:DNA-binding MarR family transcriptional regulator
VELDQAPEPRAGGPGPQTEPVACADSPPPLASLPPAERRRALVAETATFAAAFQRWTEGRRDGSLSYTRLRLLEALHCAGPSIMRDLCDQLAVSPRNMTALVDAMEEAGLVVRRPHPTDRRATLVALTAGGRREAEQALEPRLDALAGVFEGFTLDEQQQFVTVLHRLGRAMRAGPCGLPALTRFLPSVT